MEKQLSFEEIEEMLHNYSQNVDRIIKCYFLATTRICYPIIRLYCKHPELIPKNYEVDLHQLTDNKYDEFLKQHNLGIRKWQLKLDYWNTNILKWKTIISICHLSTGNYYKGYVIIETDKHGEIRKVESLSFDDITHKTFELIIALPIVLMIEQKIREKLLAQMYEAITPKINSINDLMQEIKELAEMADIVAMDR